MYAICLALALGPSALMVALNLERLKPQPIDPRTAVGEVLFFQAKWCGACRAMKPVVGQLQDEGFDIRSIDVDSHQQLAQQYGIHSIPAFVLVRDGEEVRRTSGVNSAESLRQLWR
jgi:thioredoxin 1